MSVKNPYAGARMVLANGDPIEELRIGRSQSRMLDERTGEFNAFDKKDLMNQITNLQRAIASGNVVNQASIALSSAERLRQSEERRAVLASAMQNPTEWAALGAAMATQIEEAKARQGFLRNIALGQTLRTGDVARVAMPAYDAVAIIATSTSQTGYQIIRNKMFEATEFEITANLRAEQLELEQVSGDLMDDMFNQGLDVIMVQEDRVWKQCADKTVGIVNDLEYIGGMLTPGNLARVRQNVTDWNLPAVTALIANDLWHDIIANPDFHEFLDPVTKYDLAMNGTLGTLVGLNLQTDAFRTPNQKVLNRGELYVISAPENHGVYTDRGGVRSTPTTGADMGSTNKGWLLSEPFSFTLANPRSVAKAQKV